jgi:fatty acid desaturase
MLPTMIRSRTTPTAPGAFEAEGAAPLAAAKRRRGLLRYGADGWSLLWIAGALGFSLLPWFVHMTNWQMLALGLPVFFFRSSCAYLQHNQGHLPAFWSKPLNWAYDLGLALMTGYITPMWELQHARGHHRHYLTPENDPARIQASKSDKPMSRWWYCVRGNFTIIGDSWRLAEVELAEGRADYRGKIIGQMLLAIAAAAVLLVLNWWAFLWFIVVPNLIVAFGVWWISYAHHLDVPLDTHYDGSHSHLGHAFNRLTFNIGHHAAHHEKPTLHWSLLPQRSAQIFHKLAGTTVHGELEPGVRHLAQPALEASPATEPDGLAAAS